MQTKLLFITLMLVSLFSCNSQSLDLSNIDFTKSADTYFKNIKVERIDSITGHWKIVESKNRGTSLELEGNEKSFQYHFESPDEEKQITFNGIKVDSGTGTGKIVVYENKISYYNFSFEISKTFELRKKLIKLFGQPTEIINDSVGEGGDSKLKVLLLNELSKDELKICTKGTTEYFIYPLYSIWEKGDYIYMFTLENQLNIFSNSLLAISKKAFRAKIIVGYLNPDGDQFLAKYLK